MFKKKSSKSNFFFPIRCFEKIGTICYSKAMNKRYNQQAVFFLACIFLSSKVQSEKIEAFVAKNIT